MGHLLQPWHIHTDICHHCKQICGEAEHDSQGVHAGVGPQLTNNIPDTHWIVF